MQQKIRQSFVRAWNTGLWVGIPHILISTLIILKAAYTSCFGPDGVAWIYGMMYGFLNMPGEILRIPSITSFILFAITFLTVRIVNRRNTNDAIIKRRKFIILFHFFPIFAVICVTLQLLYGTESAPDGLCYRFPTWARPNSYWSKWLHIGEPPIKDPMTCLRYRNLTNSQCIHDVAWRLLEEKFPSTEPPSGFACSEQWMKNPVTVECQNSNTNPFVYEEHTYDKCEKFSHEKMRESCRRLRAMHNKDLLACDSLKNLYSKEECYFNVDTTCKKSLVLELRLACEVRIQIEKQKKERGY